MVQLDPPLRMAQESDANELAELVNFAGEGLPLYLWSQMAGPEENAWDIGRARQTKKAGEGQIYVWEHDGRAAGSLTGYVIGPEPEPIGEDFPPIFRPLQELENEALNSWYVNVLACFPAYRGQGIGTRLLSLADSLGAESGSPLMSVIVADTNSGARKLYERVGYRETARRPCVTEGWTTEIGEWVLLTKSL